MRNCNFITRIMLILLIQCLIFSCKNENVEIQLGFNIDGRSFLTFHNDTEDSLHVNLTNWHTIPMRSQEFDTLLAPRTSFEFSLITQNATYLDLTVDGIKYKVFTIPDDNGAVTASKDTRSISLAFSGELQPINEFLVNKMVNFNFADADWMPRTNIVASAENFEDIIKTNDSITRLHLKFLEENVDLVPEWFYDFELHRLNYLNAGFKLNSLNYRKSMLNIKDTVPENFLETVLDSLPISNEMMLGNTRYMYFLIDYLSFREKSQNVSTLNPDTKEGAKASFGSGVNTILDELSGKVKDVYLTYYLSKMINLRRYAFDEEWINLVEDEKYQSYLLEEMTANPVLPTGSALPYFNLPDSSNNFIESHDYKGQILLINFWATWCKPCIQQFPYENELVDQFAGKPVKLLNIAIQTKEDSWRNMINKHGLKSDNLLAQGNWEEKLSKDFDINGLPHSVLVDWEGKIVQNKCPRASENVEELIAELLVKMEESK